MKLAVLYCFMFLLACLLTGWLRRLALAANLLDIPNERSSHVIPTPRSGGVSFVICFLCSLIIFYYWGWLDKNHFFLFFWPSLLISGVGLADDKWCLSARFRFLCHFIAALFALYESGGAQAISFLPDNTALFSVVNGLIVVFLIWCINLYNFMDGIDGLASLNAITISLSGALFFFLSGNTAWCPLLLILAFALSGFLLWNFPKAKIFMGDAGSGFLGLVLGLFTLMAAKIDGNIFCAWLIMNAVFFVDASLTLMTRALYKAPIFQAHCTHSYQHAAKFFGKHAPVTLAVVAINIIWLLPLALLVIKNFLHPVLALVLAYGPLLALGIAWGSGRQQSRLCRMV